MNIDTAPPLITLVGDPEIRLEVGQNYTELGATAHDDEDGNLTPSIMISGDTIQPETPGKYIKKYKVEDSAGNSSEKTRTIIIHPKIVKLTADSFAKTISVSDAMSQATLTLYNNQDLAVATLAADQSGTAIFKNVAIGKGYYVIQTVNEIDSPLSASVDIQAVYVALPPLPVPTPIEAVKPPVLSEVSDKNGKFEIPIKPKKAGTILEIIVSDKAGNKQSTFIEVLDKTAPIKPSVHKATTKLVTGKTEKNTTIYLYKGKHKLKTAKANSKGNFSFKIKKQKKGTKLTIFAKDKAGNKSKQTIVTVK